MIAAVTVALALLAACAGVRAAMLWRDASRDPPPPDYRGNETIIGKGYRHAVERDAAAKNRDAAGWTAVTAALGAVVTVWGAVAPLIWR